MQIHEDSTAFPQSAKVVLVPADVLVGILNYLVQRPYSEVAQAVPSLEAIVEEGPSQGATGSDAKRG